MNDQTRSMSTTYGIDLYEQQVHKECQVAVNEQLKIMRAEAKKLRRSKETMEAAESLTGFKVNSVENVQVSSPGIGYVSLQLADSG